MTRVDVIRRDLVKDLQYVVREELQRRRRYTRKQRTRSVQCKKTQALNIAPIVSLAVQGHGSLMSERYFGLLKVCAHHTVVNS
jgi:hypothetical protein